MYEIGVVSESILSQYWYVVPVVVWVDVTGDERKHVRLEINFKKKGKSDCLLDLLI